MVFEEPKGHTAGVDQRVYYFGLNRRKLQGRGDFSLGEKFVNCFFVRGTTSFYNKKLQIFPVGEGDVWNVQMR